MTDTEASRHSLINRLDDLAWLVIALRHGPWNGGAKQGYGVIGMQLGIEPDVARRVEHRALVALGRDADFVALVRSQLSGSVIGHERAMATFFEQNPELSAHVEALLEARDATVAAESEIETAVAA